eukprot:4888997-Pyramimonas_sp.AAC.1
MGDADDMCGMELMCHLCTMYDQQTNLPYRLLGFHFHAKCMAGFRAKCRAMSKDQKDEDRAMMKERPEEWRADTMPWTTGDRSKARADVKKKFTTLVKDADYSKSGERVEYLTMALEPLINYWDFWLKRPREESEAEFNRLLGIQGDTYTRKVDGKVERR